MWEITYSSEMSCLVADMRCQISHTCCTDIHSSVYHNVMSFNVLREYSCNIKFSQLLTEVIQDRCNFRLPANFFIRNLLSDS